MVATLVAFFAIGFFAATLLPLFRFLAIILSATVIVMIISAVQAGSVLQALAVGACSLALAQIGYGLGLCWVGSTRSGCIRD